jgi:hypothetical protein
MKGPELPLPLGDKYEMLSPSFSSMCLEEHIMNSGEGFFPWLGCYSWFRYLISSKLKNYRNAYVMARTTPIIG